MAKMSQKELVEEGFSDKIRGIAKAAATGIKQAAQQGVNLDTGQLTKGMYKSYKGQQPIAVLKDTLAKSKDIEIVKIDKGNIKKQQASGKKGYLGRIVGPKSITLIPFEGTLLGKVETQKQYKGSGAGVMEAFAPEDAEAAGQERDETGAIKAVHEGGRVEKQIINLLIKSGVGEEEAKALGTYAGHVRSGIMKMIKETHPQIKFTYNPKSEMGTVDVEETGSAEIQPGDIREPGDVKNRDIRENISLSLRDIIELSREVLIVESKRKAELRERARKAGVPYSRYERKGGGGLDALEKAVEAAEKAKAAEEGFKERNPEEAEPEPEAKEAEQPAAEEAGPRTVDEWIEYIKAGEADGSVESRKEEMKSAPASAWKTPGGKPIKGLTTTKVAKVLDAFPTEYKWAETYPENGKHKEFLATLDDKVVLDLLKLKQKIQPGLQIEFEDEKGVDISGVQGETGMFVAEIFRTKEGLQVGDIYRQGDPTDIVWSGGSAREKKKEVKLSPFDKAVETLKTKNNLKANALAPALNKITGGKIDDVSVITNITGKAEGIRLSDEDIVKIKNALIKQKMIKEKSSQKVLLRQLTLLSR